MAVTSLADPATAASDTPGGGLQTWDPNLYQLTVRILANGEEVDSFTRWVRP